MWVDLRSLWETQATALEGAVAANVTAVAELSATGGLQGAVVATIGTAAQLSATANFQGVSATFAVTGSQLTATAGFQGAVNAYAVAQAELSQSAFTPFQGVVVVASFATATLTATAALTGNAIADAWTIAQLRADAGLVGAVAIVTTTQAQLQTPPVDLFGVATAVVTSQAELSFTITPVSTTQPSGGWPIFATLYERELSQRSVRKRKHQELEQETAKIRNRLDREIAVELRRKEKAEAHKVELARLKALAVELEAAEARQVYGEAVAKALERAVTAGNFSALEALDRELQRSNDETEFLLMAATLILNEEG